MFQISELKLIDDQWPHFLLAVDLRVFSGMLGQPHEVYSKFLNLIPENFSSI